jgi:hypothetical protein
MHVNGARAGLPSFNARTGTLETELTDGAVVAQVKVDISDNTTMVVEQDTVMSALFALAALLDLAMIGFSMEAVEVGVEGVNFGNEKVDVLFRDQFVIIRDSIGTILRTDLLA